MSLGDLESYKFKLSRNFLRQFTFLGEQMFVVDCVTVKNANEG